MALHFPPPFRSELEVPSRKIEARELDNILCEKLFDGVLLNENI